MEIFGNVSNGWFAQVSQRIENAGRWVGNTVFGGNAGDNFYNGMSQHAQQHVSTINQQTITTATNNGATPQQAINAGSAAMNSLVHPGSVPEVGTLISGGGQVAASTIVEPAGPRPASSGIMGFLGNNMGGLIGLGIGLLGMMFSGSSGILSFLLPVIGALGGSLLADSGGVLSGVRSSLGNLFSGNSRDSQAVGSPVQASAQSQSQQTVGGQPSAAFALSPAAGVSVSTSTLGSLPPAGGPQAASALSSQQSQTR